MTVCPKVPARVNSPKTTAPPTDPPTFLMAFVQNGCALDGVVAPAFCSMLTSSTDNESDTSGCPMSKYESVVKMIVPGPPSNVDVPVELATVSPSTTRTHLPVAGCAAFVVGLTSQTLYVPVSSSSTFDRLSMTESGAPNVDGRAKAVE